MGSSRTRRKLRVGAAPWQVPKAAAEERARIGGARNLGHPSSTQGRTRFKKIMKQKRRERKKQSSARLFRKSLIVMSLDFQADPRPYPALCRPTKNTAQNTNSDKYKAVIRNDLTIKHRRNKCTNRKIFSKGVMTQFESKYRRTKKCA